MLKSALKLMCAVAATACLMAAAEPIIGTWKINTAKSQFNPGPGPKNSTSTYSMDGDWIVLKTRGVAADGQSYERTNRFKTDGNSYPFEGPNGSGKISIKKIDEYTTESTMQLDGGGSTVSRSVFSKDGKTRTQTVTGTNGKGQKLQHTIVFERQ